ncbi:sodium:proton antiporter [Syntrophorhabdus aromaticivorans]|uniref:Sodium:proton antiporter n=1 Tax=Syntrophorhabdus aromaticivorans TaxID=328301 RepID=A0A971M6L1_9BACT|nr:sodium:proton antiporter [Syntrophorhabdus aromaticivorans]NLW36071.1 sodium:proton antiporter [Syntrophorhabdus aromaticivorans]
MKIKNLLLTLLIGLMPTVLFASTEHGEASFPLWSVVFFAALILSIAVLPLINGEWWGKYYGYVSLALAIPAGILVLSIEKIALLHVVEEYISFIILLGSLFVIAGGIVIRLSAQGTTWLNCAFLLTGSVFASFMGTTGASMVLIRPLLRANKWRRHVAHICIFFIFLVSNIGGLLTPLGDPPLFLGFLRGVPFTWTFRLLPNWIFAVFIVLLIFFVVDRIFVRKEGKEAYLNALADSGQGKFEIRGKINFIFLGMVIVAFFVPPIIREVVMVVAAGFSVYFTPVPLREENAFTYHPIKEVAILFAGIFVTMVPAMKILEVSGSELGIDVPWKFFWATGILSSFLDNAPTYLVFMTAAKSVAQVQNIAQNLIVGVPETFLKAISVGAVFMGANTYIGNGPNFMVKAICEENGVSMPSFFGYMMWAIAILIPVFIVTTFIFF